MKACSHIWCVPQLQNNKPPTTNHHHQQQQQQQQIQLQIQVKVLWTKGGKLIVIRYWKKPQKRRGLALQIRFFRGLSRLGVTRQNWRGVDGVVCSRQEFHKQKNRDSLGVAPSYVATMTTRITFSASGSLETFIYHWHPGRGPHPRDLHSLHSSHKKITNMESENHTFEKGKTQDIFPCLHVLTTLVSENHGHFNVVSCLHPCGCDRLVGCLTCPRK